MPENTASGPAAVQNKPAGFRSRRQSGPAIRQPNPPVLNPNVVAQTPSTARSAPPLPKRNKGRFFVGTIFFSTFAFIAYGIWSVFLQYQSYGVVQGRLITVSSPWNGVVSNWRVREGEEVVQGQPIAEIINLEMRHELEFLLDDLKLNQAKLDAAAARLKFESQNSQSTSEKVYAEYLQASGSLEAEQTALSDLSKQLQRARKLVKSGNFSHQKYDKLYFESLGQERKIEKLKLAVAALEKRYELSKNEPKLNRQHELQPMLATIESIQSQIGRIREKIQQGQLLAPVGGRITKRLFLTGEAVELNEPVVEILEDNSTEATLFVTQENIDRFQINSRICVELPPFDKQIECEVVRLGNQLEVPPKHVAKFYSEDVVLLPIYLKPLPEYEQFLSFRINGMIKLPNQYGDRLGELVQRWSKGLKVWWTSVTTSDSNVPTEYPSHPDLAGELISHATEMPESDSEIEVNN